MAGGLAGVACWLPAIPQDVIKSRYIYIYLIFTNLFIYLYNTYYNI